MVKCNWEKSPPPRPLTSDPPSLTEEVPITNPAQALDNIPRFIFLSDTVRKFVSRFLVNGAERPGNKGWGRQCAINCSLLISLIALDDNVLIAKDKTGPHISCWEIKG